MLVHFKISFGDKIHVKMLIGIVLFACVIQFISTKLALAPLFIGV